ncbi:variant erythrocyte surface antigen-1 [Babesia bovis T2Bo]|uniref:Variant erythrocyte surface antigen-1 family protein n=1 Tax=Babesia bovis TaxID=5865 RepID=A7AMT6_BABBO|nr:variant erythrocyte surface antigen-1 [Babesia bovis T2Bo]EDO07870.1 variant erythrocyte surface antigen-1 [Babesia bovis T2Bo]|eukprot:XP_001611438.1 variant erythrocyte surface antigen-1 family protein [Babesia bovis T2Bo]
MAGDATSSSQKLSLTDSPANLKEAIDWVLRVTGKDGKSLNDDDCICGLAAAVCDLLDGVDMSHLGDLAVGGNLNIASLLSTVQGIRGTKTVRNLIEGLGKGLAKFIGWNESAHTNGGTSVDGSGIGQQNSSAEKTGYSSAYNNKNNTNCTWSKLKGGTPDRGKCARIFMGCIPLLFNGLAYLFWLCHGDGKRWNGMTIDGSSFLFLGYVMTCLGYDTKQLTKTSGSDVVVKCLTIFDDCKSKVGASYGEFLQIVYEKSRSEIATINNGQDQNLNTDHHLTILHILSTGYFRSVQRSIQENAATQTQQTSSAPKEPREPRTIREILYWLSALPYSPIYQELIQKMTEMIKRNSGEDSSMKFIGDGDNSFTIDKESIVFYLMAGCIYTPMVILSLEGSFSSDATGSASPQGTSASTPIHDLYANECFKFGFPSRATAAYSLLSDCVMALFYQLYFLKEHCIGLPWRAHGWGDCRFGYEANYAEVRSWICVADDLFLYGNNEKIEGRRIAEHRKKHMEKCGKQRTSGGFPSPLQAFLCDCLPVFTCDDVYDKFVKANGKSDTIDYPPIASHIDHRTQGQYCPIPMGYRKFYEKNKVDADSWVGYRISSILYHYSNTKIKDSCLYHLVRCIIALTGNSPHVIGTLWGYFCGFGDVYAGSSAPGGKKELEESFKKQINEWCLVKPTTGDGTTYDIGKAATLWKGGQHDAKSAGQNVEHSKGLLDTMVSCKETATHTSCGLYLDTLGGSIYKTLSIKYSTVYLSWILYLTEGFHQGLEQLQSEFKNINCSKAGCVSHSGAGSGQCGFGGECKEGNHGTKLDNAKGNCTCESIVCCAGVLPVLFKYGFTYENPLNLAGLAVEDTTQSANKNTKTLRKCDQFATQLESVVSSPYYIALLKSINAFLYWLRLPFLTVSTLAWALCLVYLLWAVLVPLDWLHFRSHLMLPGCHWLDGQGLWFKISKVVVIKDTDLDYSPLGSVDFFR